MDEVSIQDRLLAGTTCFGCGPENAKGLRLNSFPVDGEVRATFLPWPEHDNGLGFLNGGIISTVLDCHSAAAVLHEADLRGWKPYEGLPLAYLERRLREIGVIAALERAGFEPGDEVRIGDEEFELDPG